MRIIQPHQHMTQYQAKGNGGRILHHLPAGFTDNVKSKHVRKIFQKIRPVIDLEKPEMEESMKGAEQGHNELVKTSGMKGKGGMFSDRNLLVKEVVNKGHKTAEAMVSSAQNEAREVLKELD